MGMGDESIRTTATFRRETCLNGAQVSTVTVGPREQFRVELHSAFQLPTILGVLRLRREDEAKVIQATNTGETVTVEAKTCVSDLLCAGFAVKAGEMARLQAA